MNGGVGNCRFVCLKCGVWMVLYSGVRWIIGWSFEGNKGWQLRDRGSLLSLSIKVGGGSVVVGFQALGRIIRLIKMVI